MSNTEPAVVLYCEEWVGIYDTEQNLVTEGKLDLDTVTRCFPNVDVIEISPTVYWRRIVETGAPRSLRDFPLELVW